MIETIIKRNKTVEPFDAAKLNGWGEWGVKTITPLYQLDWSSIVLHTVSTLPKQCTSRALQLQLIRNCLLLNTWEANRMAGRLYSTLYTTDVFGSKRKPTVKEVHDRAFNAGVMNALNYTDEEYAFINSSIINHHLDTKSTYFEIHQVRSKYALRNKITGEEFETTQFTYIRMAMALAEDEEKSIRLHEVAKYYEHLSGKRINAPTPNYVNLGTQLNSYASCCLYTTLDTAASLAAGDHIAYMMTCMSAGIGAHLRTRSLGDPVRNGLIEHQGKLPYLRALVGAIGANLQNGRGGACTNYYTAFDPEIEVLQKLKAVTSVDSKKIRGLDYSLGSNRFFANKVAKNEDIMLFSYHDAPDLYEAQYSKNQSIFTNLYNKYLNDPNFKKVMVSARKIAVTAGTEALETGRSYLHFYDQMNIHTPFKEPINTSNLCAEITNVVKGFKSVEDLYKSVEMIITLANGEVINLPSTTKVVLADGTVKSALVLKDDDVFNMSWLAEYAKSDIIAADLPVSKVDHNGEIGLCSLAGIVVANIESDEQYAEVSYYALKMIDKCIHKSSYVFKHLEETAKARMNAAVGIIGLAHLMAKNKKKYSTQDGLEFISEVAETHAWHVINASLRLGKEKGNAPWMHKTLWPDGWLPIDTYEKGMDQFVSPSIRKRDWESLRAAIIANGGIRNSSLIAHMPSESSSQASGTTNSIYPVRDLSLLKSSETVVNSWVANDATRLKNHYQLAWDVDIAYLTDPLSHKNAMAKVYGAVQVYTDQSTSADFYKRLVGDTTIGTTEVISDYLALVTVGAKTRYYVNSKISDGGSGDSADIEEEAVGCGSGGCTL